MCSRLLRERFSFSQIYKDVSILPRAIGFTEIENFRCVKSGKVRKKETKKKKNVRVRARTRCDERRALASAKGKCNCPGFARCPHFSPNSTSSRGESGYLNYRAGRQFFFDPRGHLNKRSLARVRAARHGSFASYGRLRDAPYAQR